MVKVRKILDLFYPRKCAICNRVLGKQEVDICQTCRRDIKPIQGSICLKCGKKINENKEFCQDCKNMSHVFEWGVSCFRYKDVKDAIFRIKYAGREDLIPYFAREIVSALRSDMMQMKADCLIPIPMHRTRKRKRGYNQAELLANEIGIRMQIPVISNAVYRKIKTTPMKYLSVKQRQLNLKRAFIIGENDVKLKTIILVDDIYTTGSTVDSVATVLKRAGALKIFVVTLAIGDDQKGGQIDAS